ncbi:MAG: hypothetical protein ACI4W6_10405, partial [Acutalibacteraceae bacterium]
LLPYPLEGFEIKFLRIRHCFSDIAVILPYPFIGQDPTEALPEKKTADALTSICGFSTVLFRGD